MALSPLLLAASFAICAPGPRVTCVVDGDTFWLQGEKIRIADINTPETSQPGCARERDRYGRLLRVVRQGGRSVGAVLIAEGLAEPWRGRRSDWCGSDAPLPR